MREVFLAAEMEVADLGELAGSVARPGSDWALLERVPEAFLDKTEIANGLRFERYGADSGVERYESGLLFGPDFELRWLPSNSGRRSVRFVGEPQDGLECLKEVSDSALRGTETREESFLLWGRRVVAADLAAVGEPAGVIVFADVRIPRLLRYPVTKQTTDRVRLHVREYRCMQTARTLLWRLLDVVEEP